MLIYQHKLIVQLEITGGLPLKLLLIIDGLADGSGDDGNRGIGTELTKSVFPINEMNHMGMIVDLSHVSKNVMIHVLGDHPRRVGIEVSLHKYSVTPSHMLYAHTLVTLRTKFFGLSRITGH